jgi:NhaA family Na+:H+ antiporter
MEDPTCIAPGVCLPTRPVQRFVDPIVRFLHVESTSGIALLAVTAAALALANSSAADPFLAFWKTPIGLRFGPVEFVHSLRHWVNDGLMAIFFFVVGLEVKREFIVGELSTLRGALLPVAAAVGGMVVPAAIYIALNAGGPGAAGWGVPMATDIAFALGVLALLGSRAPDALKVFLTALAIADDIGAIIVIAIFYTREVSTEWLALALVPFAVMVLMNRMGYDEPLGYGLMGVVLWFCIFNSGIHATIAGVIAAFTIPATAKIAPLAFVQQCRLNVDEIEAREVPGAHTLEDDSQQRAALRIRDAAIKAVAPLQRLEFGLHPFAVLVVLPLFALANANIRIVGGASLGVHAVGLGVFLGLVVGKPLGISLASYLVVKAGMADLPAGVTWRHIIGAGLLGGIGFTMSLFVANLAYRVAGVENEAKIAILAASVVAGVLGYSWLRFATRT